MSEDNLENQQQQPVKLPPPPLGGNGGVKLDYFGKWITGAAFVLIVIAIVVILATGLFKDDSIVRDLASADLARGVITFIFAVGTISIALLLTLGALVGGHTQEEFAKGKEILTVLIGVFGTILGFYFGNSTGDASHKLSISPPATEASTDGKTLTMLAYVSGGDPPFTYDIKFDREDPPSINSRSSADGWIREAIDATKIGASPLGYTISVTDAHKKSARHPGTVKQQITGKAPPP